MLDITELKRRVEEYLDGNEDNLETDGYLSGQDITLEQARVLLDDFILAVSTLQDSPHALDCECRYCGCTFYASEIESHMSECPQRDNTVL